MFSRIHYNSDLMCYNGFDVEEPVIVKLYHEDSVHYEFFTSPIEVVEENPRYLIVRVQQEGKTIQSRLSTAQVSHWKEKLFTTKCLMKFKYYRRKLMIDVYAVDIKD